MNKKNNDKLKQEHTKQTKNPVLYAGSVLLLIIIAIAFVFSPGLLSQNQAMPDLGSYNGTSIVYDEQFRNITEYYIDQLESSGTQGDPMFQAMTQAFNDSVLTLAFSDEVEQSGYIPPESLVKREMVQYFLDENGVYSELLFQQASDGEKLLIEDYTIESIKRMRYADDYTNIKISQNEIDFVKNMNKNQRSFNMVSFNKEGYPREETIAFAENNAELFTTYSMDVITVNDENTANNVAGRIANNELTFSDAIAEYSIDQYSNDTGKLDDSLHYQLRDIIKGEDAFNTLTSLTSGNVSSVIETTSGYSIFSVTANPMPINVDEDAAIDSVYSYLTIYEAGVIEDYFINLSKDFNIDAVMLGYDAALALYGAENIEISSFPVNYMSVPLLDALPTSSATQLAQAQSNENFFEIAFSLQENQYSEPIVLGNDIVVLSNVVETEIDNEEDQTLNFMYPYYTQQFDSSDITSFFMGSEKLENNLFPVLLEYFL